MAELNTTTLLSDANLEGYYRGESGALTTDDSGNTRTLSNFGTVTSGTGKYGGSFNFGSSNTTKYMSTGNAMGIDGGACSIAMWVKPTGAPSSGAYFCFSAQQNSNTRVNYQINYFNNGGTPEVSFWRVRQGIAVGGGSYVHTLSTTEWTHLVLTYDGSVRGYLNNSLVLGPTATSGSGSGTIASGYYIGADIGALSKTSGEIDDNSVFSKALTAAEIALLYTDKTFRPRIIMY